MNTSVVAYLGLVVVTSAISYIAYGFDKRRAAVGGRRVPERTLLLLAFLGGWPGALLGQQRFRHKTRKMPYLAALWVVIALHVVLVGAAAYTLLGKPRNEAVGRLETGRTQVQPMLMNEC